MSDDKNKYIVFGIDGNPLTFLNPHLVKIQGVSDAQLEALKLSHQLRWMLFETAKKVLDEPLKLRALANMMTALEFEQQALWNFPQDKTYHRFFEFPGCTCPKHDNAERLGTAFKIYASDCPIHGKQVDFRSIPL